VYNIHIYHTYPPRATYRQMTGGFSFWQARSVDLVSQKSSTSHQTVLGTVAPLSIAELYMMPSGPLPACHWNVNLDPEFWVKPSQNQQSMAHCVCNLYTAVAWRHSTCYTGCVHCLETSAQGWGFYFKLTSTKQQTHSMYPLEGGGGDILFYSYNLQVNSAFSLVVTEAHWRENTMVPRFRQITTSLP